MKRLIKQAGTLLVLFLMLISCNTSENNVTRRFESPKFEIQLSYLDTIRHGEWIKFDTTLFIYHKNTITKYIDGATPPQEDYFTQENYIPLRPTSYIVYQAPERIWSESASNNEIIYELAMKLNKIKKDGGPLYKINSGPSLLYEGKLLVSRTDGAVINLELNRDNPFSIHEVNPVK